MPVPADDDVVVHRNAEGARMAKWQAGDVVDAELETRIAARRNVGTLGNRTRS
jgi:hypothetical protein